MLLREYIEKQGIPIAELGRRVGVLKRQTMHKYVKGTSIPPRDVQERIAAETGGLVRPVDFRIIPSPANTDSPDPPPQAASAAR